MGNVRCLEDELCRERNRRVMLDGRLRDQEAQVRELRDAMAKQVKDANRKLEKADVRVAELEGLVASMVQALESSILRRPRYSTNSKSSMSSRSSSGQGLGVAGAACSLAGTNLAHVREYLARLLNDVETELTHVQAMKCEHHCGRIESVPGRASPRMSTRDASARTSAAVSPSVAREHGSGLSPRLASVNVERLRQRLSEKEEELLLKDLQIARLQGQLKQHRRDKTACDDAYGGFDHHDSFSTSTYASDHSPRTARSEVSLGSSCDRLMYLRHATEFSR